MGVQYRLYKVIRYDDTKPGSDLPGITTTGTNYKVILEKCKIKMQHRPSWVQDGRGGLNYVDREKCFAERNNSIIQQKDILIRLEIEDKTDPNNIIYKETRKFKVMTDSVPGLQYDVFYVESM